MREIQADIIERVIEEAVLKANTVLPPDIVEALQNALTKERFPRAREFLEIILENACIAQEENMALCQDTGLVIVNVDLGQNISIVGDLSQAINNAIAKGYKKGCFRNSVVRDPFNRVNSGDNTPAVIHYDLSPGEHLRMAVLPKGAGSENMSQLAMLKPLEGKKGVKDFVLRVVREAGANACPPVIVGVGVGGSMEKAAFLAKKALLRPVNIRHEREDLAILEMELLNEINQLGIGPQGMGGDTTALAVNIEVYPTHIASMPVAVAIGCHSTRRVIIDI